MNYELSRFWIQIVSVSVKYQIIPKVTKIIDLVVVFSGGGK